MVVALDGAMEPLDTHLTTFTPKKFRFNAEEHRPIYAVALFDKILRNNVVLEGKFLMTVLYNKFKMSRPS